MSGRTGDPLQAVALGDAPADLVVTGGRVLLPDGRIRDRDVAVVGDRVAATPADAAAVVGEDTTVVDATDRTVIPGLVDAHDHVDIHVPIERRYHHRLARGTTAVVTETQAVASGVGPAGVEHLLAATESLPLSVFVTLPPQGFVDTFEDAGWTEDDRDRLREFLDRDRVVGVGETDWIHVVGRDAPELRAFYDRAREAGGRVVAHGAGCRGEKLAALAALADDDHEPTSAAGVEERLANGLHVVGRRGSIRDDLDAVAGADRPRGDVSLCTDGTWPQDDAGMDDVVRTAIDRGIDPVEAVEMATRAPADHFGLDDRGRIAPGYRADLAVLSDLESVAVETVLAGGEVVVRDGDPLVGERPYDYPAEVRKSVAVDLAADALAVSPASARDGRVRAIAADEGLVTRETTVEPPVEGGNLVADPEADLLKVALFDRRPGHDRGFVGFATGLGLERGAVATSITWEQPAVLAVGVSDEAIRRAIARLEAIDGGWVVVDDDPDRPERGPVLLSALSASVAGVMADRSREAVAAGYADVERALVELGGDPDPGFPRASEGSPGPLLALQTLSFPGVPVLKLSFSGYAHLHDRRIVGLDPGDGDR